jgi:chromosome segregation ATPase
MSRAAPAQLAEPPRQIGHLTEAEKVELAGHSRQLSPSRRGKGDTEEVVAEVDAYQNMIQKILDAVHMNNLPEVFAEAERLEKENREMYVFLVENEEPRRKLVEEIASLEQQYKELSSVRDDGEVTQRQKVEKLNGEIAQMQEQLEEIQAQKEKDATEFAMLYAAIDELFNALHCSWGGAPDGATTVTSANAMFALDAIETGVGDLMAGAGRTPED